MAKMRDGEEEVGEQKRRVVVVGTACGVALGLSGVVLAPQLLLAWV